MNETYEIAKENIYLELLTKCNKELDELSDKLTFVSQLQPPLKSVEEVQQTQLEARIKEVLAKIINLKEDLKI